MAGVFVRNTRLNTLWSIWYCVLVVGVQAYITYLGVKRFKGASELNWGGDPPAEINAYIGLVIISLLCVPVFVLTSLFRVGNFANDGLKLGRDHALSPTIAVLCKPINKKSVNRIWQHFCPFSETLHLFMAFCLLLPETLLQAAEIKHAQRSTGND